MKLLAQGLKDGWLSSPESCLPEVGCDKTWKVLLGRNVKWKQIGEKQQLLATPEFGMQEAEMSTSVRSCFEGSKRKWHLAHVP